MTKFVLFFYCFGDEFGKKNTLTHCFITLNNVNGIIQSFFFILSFFLPSCVALLQLLALKKKSVSILYKNYCTHKMMANVLCAKFLRSRFLLLLEKSKWTRGSKYMKIKEKRCWTEWQFFSMAKNQCLWRFFLILYAHLFSHCFKSFFFFFSFEFTITFQQTYL